MPYVGSALLLRQIPRRVPERQEFPCSQGDFLSLGRVARMAEYWLRLCDQGPLAQLVELRTFNPQVVGSSPTGPTFCPRFLRGLFDAHPRCRLPVPYRRCGCVYVAWLAVVRLVDLSVAAMRAPPRMVPMAAPTSPVPV